MILDKHDTLVDKIHERLVTGKYDNILKQMDYGVHQSGNGPIGEIDNAAIRRGKNRTYLLLFEIKSYNKKKLRKKAYEQLFKEESYIYNNVEDNIKVYKFYVYGKRFDGYDNNYSVNWVRDKKWLK